jgi:cytochrome c-type biogenesis protein CcmH
LLGAALIVLAIGAGAVLGARDLRVAQPVQSIARTLRSDVPSMRDTLVEHLQRNAGDGRGWIVLAMMDMRADRFEDAARAFERGIAASRRVAADPAVWCEYADALGMTQGGSLAGRPTQMIERALELSPGHPKALEMAGSAAYERRDFAAAVDYWRRLLPQLAEGTLPHAQLSAAIERAQRLAATSLRPNS